MSSSSRTRIERITPTGIEVAGRGGTEFDVIVYATGFRCRRLPHPDDGRRERGESTCTSTWAGDAKAYLGMTIPGFPNFFCLYGPNHQHRRERQHHSSSRNAPPHYIVEGREGPAEEHAHNDGRAGRASVRGFNDEVDAATRSWRGAPPGPGAGTRTGTAASRRTGLPAAGLYWRRTREPDPDDFLFS